LKIRASPAWRRALRWLPGLLVSLLAVAVLLQLASWQEVGAALQAMDVRSLAAATGVFLASILARGMAWRTLLKGRASLLRTFVVLNEGYLLNNLFPFRLGELGRALLMGSSTGLGTFHILATILIERLYDLAITAMLLLATLPLVLGMEWARPLAWSLLAAVLLGLAGLFLAARTRRRWKPRLAAWLQRSPGLAARLLPRLDAILDGLGALTDPLQFLSGLAWMGLSWALVVTKYVILLRAAAPQAPVLWAVFCLAVAAVGVAVPSAPAGLGVFEATVVGALALVGVSSAAALAFAVIVHLIYFIFTCGIGLLGLAREGETIVSLYQRVARFQMMRSQPSAGVE
jgi:hypothetical protein